MFQIQNHLSNDQQVEHIINESRVRQRQEKVKQVVNPTPVTMSVSKQLTAVMRAEAHILYRMMEHPLVLNDYRLRDDGYGFASLKGDELHTVRDRVLPFSGEVKVISQKHPTEVQVRLPYKERKPSQIPKLVGNGK